MKITTITTGLAVFAFTFLFGTNEASAKIWRLNNNAGVSADVTASLAAAHDSASSGDTILVEPSATSYGTAYFSKQLYVFGPGYFLSSNDSTQANPSPASVIWIQFDPGSEGSFVTGLTFTQSCDIRASNIIVKRNYILDQGMIIRNGVDNIMILQNFIYATSGSNGHDCIEVQTGSSNIFIHNNYLRRWVRNTTTHAIQIDGTSSADISNNTIRGNININSSPGSNFVNNILLAEVDTMINGGGVSSMTNNIEVGNQLPVGAGNLSGQVATDIHELTGSTDGQFKLKAGSPAIGAGVGGIDCGMYGGLDPYVLSGIPEIPAIYHFFAPSSGTSSTGLDVHIKVKSH